MKQNPLLFNIVICVLLTICIFTLSDYMSMYIWIFLICALFIIVGINYCARGDKKVYRVLYLDLDGTLINPIDKKDLWSKTADDWIFTPNIISSLVNYKPDFIHIVTNRGDILQGDQSKEDFLTKMNVIIDRLSAWLPDTAITYDYEIANRAKPTVRYKPNIGMIREFRSKLKDLPISEVFVGDSNLTNNRCHGADELCAYNAGIEYIFIDDFIKSYNSYN